MLKIIGACFIILSSTMLGFYFAKKLSDRTIQLRSIQMSLQLLETEICYGSTPLQLAFSKVSRMDLGSVSALFETCNRYFDQFDGATTTECWRKALEQHGSKFSLKQAEMEWLHHFGRVIGNSDRDDQKKHLHLIMSHFKKAEVEARDEELKYEKMYKTLGFLAGAVIVILML